MKAFYFGPPQRQLFGVYHMPLNGAGRKSGVVLCYPLGQEYIRVHRAFRQLAVLLARTGLHVLRFDYLGCGDSAGEGDDGSPAQWITDISAAVDGLRALGGSERVSLVGLRLGATLAAVAGSERGDIENAVLWEPVVSGREYVKEQLAAHCAWVRSEWPGRKNGGLERGLRTAVLGFPFTEGMQTELAGLDLLRLSRAPAGRVLIVENRISPAAERLRVVLQANQVATDHERTGEPDFWVHEAGVNTPLVPPRALRAVVSWLGEVCA